MPDIFDELTRDFSQQEGDIFDPIPSDSDESSSSRGASSISAPRSPVAAQSATSAGANPAPGSTAFTPQPSSQGQKAGAQLFGPLAAPGNALLNVAPAALAQGVSPRNKLPLRRQPAQPTIAPPVQQQKQVIQRPQAPLMKQAPSSSGKQSDVKERLTWYDLAQHPGLGAVYTDAWNHLSPQEKREMVNKRIADYPENRSLEQRQQAALDETPPDFDVNSGELTPSQRREYESRSIIPNATMPALAAAKRYLVDPFERMVHAVREKGGDMVESLGTPSMGGVPEVGIPGRTAEEHEQDIKEFERERPRTAGILRGIGATAGEFVGDPRMWPFFFAGPEVAGGRFLSRAANPTLQHAVTAGLTAQTAYGVGQQAAQLHQIWNRQDISLDEKYEAIAELILNAITIAKGVRDAGHGEASPQPLDPKLAAEIDAMGDEPKRQVFSHLEQKVAREQASQSGTQTQRLPSDARRSSGSVTTDQARTSAVSSHNVPAMGHGMTSDSPAVRRIKAEARPVRGQEPTVKVKQEPTAIQAALTQPPAPVPAEEAARIGQRDSQSGRTILQPSNNLIQNERLANQAAPDLETRLSHITKSVPGAKLDRLRPQKGLERLQAKVEDGKPPRTISDNLAAQVIAPNVEAKDQLIAGMKQEFPVISVDDRFTQPRDKAGYPSANVQVQMPNGGTAEVQIVTPEVQAKTDQTHRLYTLGRSFPEGSAERAHYWDQAAAIHAQALEKFRAREARESQGRSPQAAGGQQSPAALARGQRVVLKNGQTGKIVDFTKKFDRVVVRTSKGLKTVKPEQVQSRIDLPRRTVSSPDFEPRDLKKFTGKVESRLGAPEAQRGEIVLINTDALHEIQNALKDHSFAGVTLPGEVADNVIAKIRVRAEKTGREDLDLLADHLERAKSRYGVVPVALEGSNKAKNVSANLEERIHGAQMDIGKGLLETYGDADKDYAHPKTALFFPWLESRGEDADNKIVAVSEIANLILRGEHQEAGVSDQDALNWITDHILTIKSIHGRQAIELLRRASGEQVLQLLEGTGNE